MKRYLFSREFFLDVFKLTRRTVMTREFIVMSLTLLAVAIVYYLAFVGNI